MNFKTKENSIYLYDGSFDGLLTISFDCYIKCEIPCKIISKDSYIFNMLDEVTFYETNETKSKRIYDGIVKNISYDTLYNCYYAFLSGNTNNICDNKEIEILKYILNGFKVGSNINNMLSLDYVLKVQKLRKNTLHEAHRLKGLVRLSEVGNNLWYSSIHPDNNVIEQIGHFLMKRFPTQNLILHDKNRNLAFLYNEKNKDYYEIISVPINFKVSEFSEEELEFQNLWKTFFNTIAIKERTNSRLQMQYMPKKYWNDLVEMNRP